MSDMRKKLLNEGNEHIRIAKESDVIVLYGTTPIASVVREILKDFEVNIEVKSFDKKTNIDKDEYSQYTKICVILCGMRLSTRLEMEKDATDFFGTSFCIDFFSIYYLWVELYLKRNCDMEILAHTLDEVRNDRAMHNIDCINTSYCNLNCKECSNGIPYRKNKKFVSVDAQVNALKQITDIIPLAYCNIQGGEPLLDKRLSEEIYKIASNPRIAFITIATNGTVVPDEPVLEATKNTGCIFRISNYGDLSTKIDEFMTVAKQHNVPCDIYERVAEWMVYGDFKKRGRGDTANMKIAEQCMFGTKDIMLYDNMLYCCCRTLFADAIDQVKPEVIGNCININDELSQNDLLDLIKGKNLYKMCDYCEYPMKIVVPAEQLERM